MQEKNNNLLVALVDVLASLDSKKKLKNLLNAQSAEEAMIEIQGRYSQRGNKILHTNFCRIVNKVHYKKLMLKLGLNAIKLFET